MNNYNHPILFINSRNFVWTICTYIMDTLHYVDFTLHITHMQPSYNKLWHIAYDSWTLHETLNKRANPFIIEWQYFSFKGDHFNKFIHTSTYILHVSHPCHLRHMTYVEPIKKIYTWFQLWYFTSKFKLIIQLKPQRTLNMIPKFTI